MESADAEGLGPANQIGKSDATIKGLRPRMHCRDEALRDRLCRAHFLVRVLVRAVAGARAVLPDRLPGRGIPRPSRAGIREDRRQRRRGAAGRAPDRRLHAAAPAQLVLLPVGDRDAGRVPAARRTHEESHDLSAAAQRAARGGRRPRAVGRRRRSREARLGRRRRPAAAGDGVAGWPLGAGDGRGAGRGGGRGAAPVSIYAEFSPAENLGQSRGELVSAETARANDFWDGAVSRQKRFVELLRARQPRAEIRNLNPILDEHAQHQEHARDRDAATGVADRRARLDGSDAQHRSGRHRVPARRRRALRLPRQRRAAGRLPLHHRQRHREHQQHALLPEHVHAQGRRPRPDGLRSRLPLLHQRHRPCLACQRHVPALAARAAAVHPRVPQRRDVAHQARG